MLSPTQNKTAPRKILLIDDDREILQGASIRLRAAGYETITAQNAEQGLAAATASKPDAILMDVRLPRKDGLTTMSELREQEPTRNIPIVVLSASVADQQRALEAGAKFFLRKPYQGKTLVAAVQSAVTESDIEKEDPHDYAEQEQQEDPIQEERADR